jgi:TetR/AcrR family transcriptional regulator, cholesterol catabolism regulator
MATAGPRRTRATGERRNREAEILRAAIDVFWRKGYSAATIQDVADQVGVLKGSLYYYIDTKEDLLFRVFEESHRQASEIAEQVLELDLPALGQLHEYFKRYVLWYLRNLERVSLYFNEWRYLQGARRRTVVAQRRTYEEFVRSLIERGQQEGDIDPSLNVKYACFFVLGAVNGVPTWYRRRGPDSPEQIASAYADMIIGTLTNTRSAESSTA